MSINLDTLSMPEGFFISSPMGINVNRDKCDINGDGFNDILIGSPYETPYAGLVGQRINAGMAYVVFGKSSGFGNIADINTITMPQGFKILGAKGCWSAPSCTTTGDVTGAVLSCADVNGDGYSDALIFTHFGGTTSQHGMYIIFGKSSGFSDIDLLNLSLPTGISITNLGTTSLTIRNGGDLNNDGYEEILIGAPYDGTSSSGFTTIVYGRSSWTATISTTTDANTWGLYGNYVSGYSGRAVCSIGNFNGDLYDDIAINNPLGSHTGGIIYIIYGSSSEFVTNPDLNSLISSNQGIAIYGTSTYDVDLISGIGDVNGDGFDDLLIGGLYGIVIFGGIGKSSVDLSLPLSSSVGFIMSREYFSSTIGPGNWPVSGVGDFNNDGYTDFAVGVGGSYGGPYIENSYLVLGHANPFLSLDLNNQYDLTNYIRVKATIPAAQFVNGGVVPTDIGDINGDGYSDLCFAQPDYQAINFIFGGNNLNTYDVPDPTASNSNKPANHHGGGQPSSGGSTSSTDAGTIAGAVVGTVCAVTAVIAAAYYLKNKNAPGAAAAASTIQMNEVKAYFTEDKSKKSTTREGEEITELCNDSLYGECDAVLYM